MKNQKNNFSLVQFDTVANIKQSSKCRSGQAIGAATLYHHIKGILENPNKPIDIIEVNCSRISRMMGIHRKTVTGWLELLLELSMLHYAGDTFKSKMLVSLEETGVDRKKRIRSNNLPVDTPRASSAGTTDNNSVDTPRATTVDTPSINKVALQVSTHKTNNITNEDTDGGTDRSTDAKTKKIGSWEGTQVEWKALTLSQQIIHTAGA